ncbi:MAG: RNase H family protein [Brevinema sp.]
MTISYQELLQESQKFISYLHEQNIDAALDEASFRDYHVKIKLLNTVAALYHKPSKKTFSLSVQISADAQKEHIQDLWHSYLFPDEKAVTGLCAYVDGSFMDGKISWACVIAENNELVFEGKGLVPLSAEEGSRQIAGEVYAVLNALEYLKNTGEKTLTIYYDYKGLEMWATKKWKANSPIAQFYVAKLMQYRVSINWKKVKAHTGHRFNEQADRLAKLAIKEDANNLF